MANLLLASTQNDAMPQHLDPATKKLVLQVSSCTTLIILSFMLLGLWSILPKLRRRETIQKHNKSLLLGCLLTLILMSFVSTLLTLPVIYRVDNDGSSRKDDAPVLLSSSINFCEQDFRHSTYIAEPANVASSLGSYVPLALLGLFGPPSQQWRGTRFVVLWLALLSIGLGSTALHSLLTSYAQGGDELPMLWYTAATSYCLLDVITLDWLSSKQNDNRSSFWLCCAVVLTAVAATATYVVNRSDFTVFYILFSIYSYISGVGLLYIVFLFDWERRQPLGQQVGLYFRSRVLMPLALTSATLTIAAVWTWVSEMVLCQAATRSEDPVLGEFGFFVWNRLVHPLWHFTSAVMAWNLAWIIVAAHGMQRGWGVPRIDWFGAPYVMFEPLEENDRTSSVSGMTNQHVKQS